MKHIKAIVALAIFMSFASSAATMISNEEAGNYQKVGVVMLDQSGLPNIGHKEYSQAADKKCQEAGGIPQDQCFYRIIDINGHESNHKNISIDVYKK